MNILILGGGGREHALAWAFAANPKCDRLWCAPGNAGIAEVATCVALDILDGDKVLAFARENDVGFVMIGPEAPLAEGVADVLRAGGLTVFGPSRAAARLEASKAFTKEICAACGAPTAESQTFTDPAAARAYVTDRGAPIVVKADGLAAGKGVTVAASEAEALAALDAIFAEGPGARVVIEAVLAGEEASLFVLADGEALLALGTAQDHKRAFDGDEGPNTGGMGAYSPAPVMTAAVTERALDEIVRPTLAEMVRRGTPFQGMLYAGLMIEDGAPRLVEYNVRFGDPETQALALRLGAQLLDACLACAEGRLAEARVNWADDHALTVVIAARGYPGDARPRRGRRARGAARPVGATVPRRHAPVGRGSRLRRRPRAERHRPRRNPGRGPRPRLCAGGRGRLARRLLPTRHRLAGAGAIAIAHGLWATSHDACDTPAARRLRPCDRFRRRRSGQSWLAQRQVRTPGRSGLALSREPHLLAQAPVNRAHVIDTAAALFRERGIHGIGIADLMKAAGMTHGGFYRQFKPKDDLAVQAVAQPPVWMGRTTRSPPWCGSTSRPSTATRRPAGAALPRSPSTPHAAPTPADRATSDEILQAVVGDLLTRHAG